MPDTNVMIAALQGWHTHHERARNELRRRLDEGERMVLVGHALLECYSVLTRLPPPQRLSPAVALGGMRDTFIDRGTVVASPSEAFVTLMERAIASGVAGGRIHDAYIAECARQAGADVLVTFNVRHFANLATGIEIHEPGVGQHHPR